jgi:hypothetical protein
LIRYEAWQPLYYPAAALFRLGPLMIRGQVFRLVPSM